MNKLRKIFNMIIILTIIFLFALFVFPHKIYLFEVIARDKMSLLKSIAENKKNNMVEKTKTIARTISEKVKKPILKLCPFQESKLACLLKFEDLPIKSSCFVNGSLLKDKIRNGFPGWAKAQIKEDLSKFKTINRKDLIRYFKENTDPDNILVLVEIKNKKVKMTYANNPDSVHNIMGYVQGGGAVRYVLEYLTKNGYIPDTVFLISLADFYTPIGNHAVPIFAFCKDLNVPIEKDLILIPDWQNLGSVKNLRDKIRVANKLVPWENKKNILFWRGGQPDSTGFREKLISFAQKNGKLIDAEFVNVNNNKKPVNFVTPEKHLDYKYLISIDGYRGSWERLIWHLHSNSLVFKHQSNQVQWYYKGIAPWVDYIPIINEESILESVRWAESHPKEVQSIIRHASNFVEENLSLEDMYHYIAVLLQEYNKRLVD